jgi:hypothetical protein
LQKDHRVLMAKMKPILIILSEAGLFIEL